MKPVNSMIATDGREFYMRVSYCNHCWTSKVVALRDINGRCPTCHLKLNYRWKSIGTKLDDTEYTKSKSIRKRMARGRDY